MAVFGAQIDLGSFAAPHGTDGPGSKLLGISADENNQSLLVTPTPYDVYVYHLGSRSRTKSWPIPKDLGPLVGPALWSDSVGRYVALGRNGDVLVHWSAGVCAELVTVGGAAAASRVPANLKMRRAELPSRAWRVLRCPGRASGGRCVDNLWLAFGNGYTVSVSAVLGGVGRAAAAASASSVVSPRRVAAGGLFDPEESGLRILDAAVFCRARGGGGCGPSSGHRVGFLVGATSGVGGDVDPRSLQVILSGLEAENPFTSRLALFDGQQRSDGDGDGEEAEEEEESTAPVVVVTAGGGGDEEGSDEGFIDSMDARMAEEDDEDGGGGRAKASPSATTLASVATTTTAHSGSSGDGDEDGGGGGAVKSYGQMLASSFYSDPVTPALITLWQDGVLRRTSLRDVGVEEDEDDVDEDGRNLRLLKLMTIPNREFTSDLRYRPSIAMLDGERFVLHASDGDGGSLSVWNSRWGGVCEDYRETKMYDPLSDPCRVSSSWAHGGYVAFAHGRAAFVTCVRPAPPSTLASVLGFAVLPAFKGNFANATFLNVPFLASAGGGEADRRARQQPQLLPAVDQRWERPLSVNHYGVPDAGDKAVASYIREGRIQELIDCMSNDKLFLRESLVISVLKYALDLEPRSRHLSEADGDGGGDDENDDDGDGGVAGLKSRLIAQVLRQPIAMSYLAKRMPALDEARAFRLMLELFKLVDESSPVWSPSSGASGSLDPVKVIDWLSAVVDGQFPSLSVRRGSGSKDSGFDPVLLKRKYEALSSKWNGVLKDMRGWDGPLAEVKRRAGEVKSLKADDKADIAKKSGVDALAARFLGRPGPQSTKAYRIRVISKFW